MNKKLRKTIFGVAIAGSVIAGGGVAYASHSFPDVPTSNQFHDDIDFMESRNISGGFGDGTYRPNNNVTRGQMARFMNKLADALTPTVLQAGSVSNITSADRSPCEITGYVAPDYEQQATIMGVVSLDTAADAEGVWLNPEFSANGGASWTDTNSGSPEVDYTAGVQAVNAATGAHAINPSGTYSWQVDVSGSVEAGTYCDLVVTISHRMPGDIVDSQNTGANPQG